MSKNMRAQIFSIDLILAVFVFMLVFGVLLISWNNTIDKTLAQNNRKDMELIANNVADFFVSSGGHPYNWISDPQNASTIGLVRTDRIIDNNKLNTFLSMNYNDAKKILKITGYNFYFRLVNAGLAVGLYDNTSTVAFASRIVMYNGEPEVLEFFVWRYG